MRTIIHLSDLHVGYPDLGARLRYLVQQLIFFKEPGSKYVVVISGDLVEDATQFDAYSAVRRQVDNLTGAGFEVLVCPGNHDYGTGSFAHKRYVAQFKRTFFGDAAVTYPKLDVVEGCAFIGLDTMAEELGFFQNLAAEGEIGNKQLRRLDKLLSEESVMAAEHRVLYMHHHPFDPRPFHHLKDTDELREVLKGRNVNTLLYGHNHEGKIGHGKWGIPRCFDAGTATGKRNGSILHRVFRPAADPGDFYHGDFLNGYFSDRAVAAVGAIAAVETPVG